MGSVASIERYRFGAFELQLDERRLLKDGQSVVLRPRAFDLLAALVDRAGHLVTKDELFDRVWPKPPNARACTRPVRCRPVGDNAGRLCRGKATAKRKPGTLPRDRRSERCRVNAYLARKGLLLKRGSIVDATIIAAPSSTKNAEGERDPEMRRNVRRFFWRPRAILATIAEWDIKVRPRPGAWLQLRTDDGNAASRHETSPYFADARPCGPRARRRTPSRRRCR